MFNWLFATVSETTAEMMVEYIIILAIASFAGIAGWLFMQGATNGPRWINPLSVGFGTTVFSIIGLSLMMT